MRQDIKQRIEQVRRGEVPAGYKQTQVGIIPDMWQVEKLEEHLDEYDVLSNDHENISVATSSREGLLMQSDYYQQQRFNETRLGYHVVPRGYITYRHMSDDDIFRFNVNDVAEELLVSAEYPVFKAKSSLNQSFLLSYLNTSPYFLSYCRAQKKGSTRTRMYFKNLEQFSIPFPSWPEQDRITEIISCCDKVISLKQQLIDEKRQQKKWLMRNLLDPDSGVRLSGFEGKWVKKRIDYYGLFINGSGFPIAYQKGTEGYPFYKVSDFNNAGNERTMCTANNHVTSHIAKKLRCNIIPGKSIVFAKIGAAIYLERKRMVKDDCCIDNNMMAFHVSDELASGDYMCYLFQTIKFGKLITMTALPSLNKKRIGAITKKFPPTKNEQTAIADILSTADREIDLLEQELAEWQSKKKALMQLLLTGIVRV